MSEELKGCPFCGSVDVHYYSQMCRDGLHEHISCRSCLSDFEGSKDEWNTRPREQELEQNITELLEALKLVRNDLREIEKITYALQSNTLTNSERVTMAYDSYSKYNKPCMMRIKEAIDKSEGKS